jgi:hypothetical protein
VFHFNNTGDDAVRTVRLNAKHAANAKPSRFGDAVGKWEGETLVIDTIAFEPNPSGLFVNIPSSAQKHTVERLTLTDDNGGCATRRRSRTPSISRSRPASRCCGTTGLT